jgi:hypothetical protein
VGSVLGVWLAAPTLIPLRDVSAPTDRKGGALAEGSSPRKEGSMKVALALRRIGLNSSLMHGLGLGSIVAALSLWARSAAVSDKDRKARAERLAIFVGLWPPTFVLLGKVLQDMEATPEEQVVRALESEQEAVSA